MPGARNNHLRVPHLSYHHRNASWPPNLALISQTLSSLSPSPKSSPRSSPRNSHDELAEIDEDPFSHFLSPMIEGDDPYDEMSMSAGILPDMTREKEKEGKFRRKMAKRWARYVWSLHAESRSSDKDIDGMIVEEVEDGAGLGITEDVGEEISEMEERHEPTRGRAQELVGDRRRRERRRGRRSSRTLSGHRRSWREPSVDLFTVMEEGEATTRDEDEMEGIEDAQAGLMVPSLVLERSRL